jgi:predicted DNA-binding transcriptional regulator AlpA
MVPQANQTTEGSALAHRGPETAKPPLRSAEAARYINMSDSWLRQSRMEGRTDGPPFVRSGGRSIRYRLADLDRWLEQRVCTGGRPQPDPQTPAPKRASTRNATPAKRPNGRRRGR